jgi:hypothetical protein
MSLQNSSLHFLQNAFKRIITSRLCSSESSSTPIHWSKIPPTIPCPFCNQKFRSSELVEFHIKRFHVSKINEKLRAQPEKTYKAIFGSETIKIITATEMRYPDGLLVTMDGPFKGCW